MPTPRRSLFSSFFLAALVAALVGALVACGPKPPARSPTEREADSAAAVAALQGSRFAEAAELAGGALAKDPRNGRAAAVRAIAAYQAAGSQLRDDVEQLFEHADGMRALDHQEGRAMWRRFADALAKIDGDLAVAADDEALGLELCLACWEHDWNHSGEVDERDRRLFEIEYDGRAQRPEVAPAPAVPTAPVAASDGQDDPPPPELEAAMDDVDPRYIPEGDPRRRPTFRFDAGDADWARAMLSFQRAAMELILAYQWSELDKLFASHGPPPRLVIPVKDKAGVSRARALIIAGLGYADRCRAAYLAETDDDREWVPSPTQKNHPIPLDVDAALYQTWADLTGDLRRLLESKEGLSLRAAAAFGDEDELGAILPDAYLDLGAMLREPADLVIDLRKLEALEQWRDDPAGAGRVLEQMLRGLFGKGYAGKMADTKLLQRFERMKRELSTGEDTFERKLRYLLWLN